jgi:hypothetical protein
VAGHDRVADHSYAVRLLNEYRPIEGTQALGEHASSKYGVNRPGRRLTPAVDDSL